jgi:hypothetical protein
MLDVKKYFNENRRNHYWLQNKEKYQRFFYRKLMDLKNAIELDTSEADLKLDTYRGLGYLGIGTQSGLTLGVRTLESKQLKQRLGDHVIGTVEIGRYIHKECEKNNWDFEYMVKTWLYENLWIWSTIIVSKEEHKNENIRIDSDGIEDKRFLKHYINVSDFYESKLNGKKILFD